VFIATHSIDVLYELPHIASRDGQVIVLRKTRDDVLHYKILYMDDLEDFIDRSVDPRKIMDMLES